MSRMIAGSPEFAAFWADQTVAAGSPSADVLALLGALEATRTT